MSVKRGLVVAVSCRLELERRVLDVEVSGETRLQLIEQSGGATRGEAVVCDHHMHRERW
jgi:hypothetical protein